MMTTIDFTYTVEDETAIGYINNRSKQFTDCLIYLYTNLVKNNLKSAPKKTLKDCQSKFKLTNTEVDCIHRKTKQVKKTFEAKKEVAIDEIAILEKDIKELLAKTKLTSKDKKSLIVKRTKLAKKKKFLNTKIVFGAKHNIKQISYLNNLLNDLEDTKENEDEIEDIKNRLDKHKTDFNRRRIGDIYIVGDSGNNGNRYFDFDLKNRTIIYKPNRNTNFKLSLNSRKIKDVEKLQEMINNEEIPITVSLNKDKISISYDIERLNNYNVKAKDREVERKIIKEQGHDEETQSKLIKDLYKDYFNEQRDRQLEGKLSYRYMAADMNPNYMGISIIDVRDDLTYKVVKLFALDFTELNKKSKKASDDDYSLYLTNKRKHEKLQAIDYIFDIAKHYKVAYFVTEELDFIKNKGDIKKAKEFNRLTNNVWNRTLITNSIKKKCAENGIQIIDVLPMYSSLIGNFKHKLFDPISASLEIARRGAFKYIKGMIYPEVSDINEMVRRVHLDIRVYNNNTLTDWKEVFKVFNKTNYRFGKQHGLVDQIYLNNKKSKIKLLNYTTK